MQISKVISSIIIRTIIMVFIFLMPLTVIIITDQFTSYLIETLYFPDWFSNRYFVFFDYLVLSIVVLSVNIKLRGKRIKKIVLWSGVFILFINNYIGEQVFKSWKEEERKYISGIEIGITEEKVVEKLGNPFRMYYSSSAPVDYYVKGFSRRKRIIENKVYIFSGAMDKIFYIYFDKNNKVKFISTCGS